MENINTKHIVEMCYSNEQFAEVIKNKINGNTNPYKLDLIWNILEANSVVKMETVLGDELNEIKIGIRDNEYGKFSF